MKKRILSLALALVMCLGLAAPALAAEIVDSGKCGDDLTWTLDSEGTLTISGTGDMWDLWVPNAKLDQIIPWRSYPADTIRSIIVEEGITTIGSYAFSGLNNLTSVKLPDGITVLPDLVFAGCSSLKNITIPKSVTKIAPSAFAECNSLTSITIPASVELILNNPFYACKNLREIKVDSANTEYFSQNGVLYTSANNKNLHRIVLIAYPPGKMDTSFVVPENAVVSSGAFETCDSLTHITLSNVTDSIGPFLAIECPHLKSITIPTSAVTIVESAGLPIFNKCDNLSDIYYPGTKAQWEAIEKRPSNIFDGMTIHYNSTGPDSQSAVPPVTPVFTDVPSSAYYAAPVSWAVEQEITSGTSTTTFSPSQDCTNAQILTFLWRACGKPAPEINSPFTNDIPDAYLQAAVWAYEQGMVSGSAFDVNQPCTRAMAVTYIWQACGSPAPEAAANFSDIPAGADYTQAVAWAVEQAVTTGTGDTTFSPESICSRGQIVTFLHRAMAEK